MRTRTKRFALRIIRLFSALPATEVARTLGKQILRSGTSVGAQYREGVRSRSDAEIISKWGGALQELEETSYWLELLAEAEVVPAAQLTDLMRECGELIAITTTCVKNVKGRNYA
ncbi:MAG: four helix bundle protein [Gemmataceae bacterium]|nr:four helix bundle protein [Gemmataceae bacterium]